MGRGESWAWPLASGQPASLPPLSPHPILALRVDFLTCAMGALWVVVGNCVWQLEPARNHGSQTYPGS